MSKELLQVLEEILSSRGNDEEVEKVEVEKEYLPEPKKSSQQVFKSSDHVLQSSDRVLQSSDHDLKSSDHVLKSSDDVLKTSDPYLKSSDHVFNLYDDLIQKLNQEPKEKTKKSTKMKRKVNEVPPMGYYGMHNHQHKHYCPMRRSPMNYYRMGSYGLNHPLAYNMNGMGAMNPFENYQASVMPQNTPMYFNVRRRPVPRVARHDVGVRNILPPKQTSPTFVVGKLPSALTLFNKKRDSFIKYLSKLQEELSNLVLPLREVSEKETVLFLGGRIKERKSIKRGKLRRSLNDGDLSSASQKLSSLSSRSVGKVKKKKEKGGGKRKKKIGVEKKGSQKEPSVKSAEVCSEKTLSGSREEQEKREKLSQLEYSIEKILQGESIASAITDKAKLSELIGSASIDKAKLSELLGSATFEKILQHESIVSAPIIAAIASSLNTGRSLIAEDGLEETERSKVKSISKIVDERE